ncbi:MAG: urate hydroxylase PuuD [Mycobacteriales bacterium]|nr:urate hydroxylase PuuD [Frankia sp.]
MVEAAAIFTRTGGEILARWGHYLAGITWIGLLYYFNFVQTPSFATFEAGPRTEAVRKLVPRALWWFRWAAAFTVLTGILILWAGHELEDEYFGSVGGTAILTGALLGITMLANVWLVIWPNQKVVIASAEGVAAGREADPAATAAGRRGAVASRTNTLFSIPLLFFMGAASHFHVAGEFAGGLLVYWIIVIAIVAFIELNSLGVWGGVGPGPLRQPLESVRSVIISGFVLWVILYALFETLVRKTT